MKKCVFHYILALALLYGASGFSQTPDTSRAQSIPPVLVTSTRMDGRAEQLAWGLSVIGQNAIQTGQQQLSAIEFLPQAPGVVVMNADNYAQDLRISIRGVGARAAFGIRGIRLMVDDLPESTPDGQGQVDNLDPGILQRVEVLRGPGAALYGNASGGVLSFYTEDGSEKRQTEAGISAGTFGFQQYQLKTGGKLGAWRYFARASQVRSTGYRDHSGMRNSLFSTKWRWIPNDKNALLLLLNLADSPQADDAGALNRAQADTLPSQARDVNILYQAGESVLQARAGAVFQHAFSAGSRLKLRAFHTYRDFENKLGFNAGGIVGLERQFSGLGGSYFFEKKQYRLHTGFDLERQSDARQRFNNEQGMQGDRVFDQTEIFRNLGVFALNALQWANKWEASAHLRFDAVRVQARDHFLSDGDDSDRQDLQNLSGSLGIRYSPKPAINVYANFSTGFEVPALSELSANPEGSGGFNTGLKAQQSFSYEAGVKGLARHWRYEAAVYHVDARNELAPYELAQFPGRTFYRNSGRSTRSGLELALHVFPTSALRVTASMAQAVFVYREYAVGETVFDGKWLPGLPRQTLFGEVFYGKETGWYGALQLRHLGRLYADDANANEAPAYTLLQLRCGYRWQLRRLMLEPYAGLNNLGNTRYYANIRLNAAGNRYYEPASGIGGYVGLRVRV